MSALKSREVPLTADETLRQRVVDYYDQPYDETMTIKESQAAFPDWMAGIDRFTETGAYTAIVVGLDGAYLDYVLEYCPFTSGSFDRAAFESGDYVIAGGAYHEVYHAFSSLFFSFLRLCPSFICIVPLSIARA